MDRYLIAQNMFLVSEIKQTFIMYLFKKLTRNTFRV